MNELKQKYSNFQRFCLDIDDKNEWVIYLSTVPLELFINTFKTKSHLSIEQIKEDVINIAKFDRELVKQHEAKLDRYLSYFFEISKL